MLELPAVFIGLFFLTKPLIDIAALIFGVAILGTMGGVLLIDQGFQMRRQEKKALRV